MNDNELNSAFNYPIKQYEGPKEYVFVSYSYKDSNAVFPNLELMERFGINVSYNDHLPQSDCQAPCRESKIKDSSIFIPLLTPNFVDSESCSLDIFYASFHRRNIIPIYLKETELSERLKNLIGNSSISISNWDDEKFDKILQKELNAQLNNKKDEVSQYDLLDKLYGTGKIDKQASISVKGLSEILRNSLEYITLSSGADVTFKHVYLSFSHEDMNFLYYDLEMLRNIRLNLFKLKFKQIDIAYDMEIDFYKVLNQKSDFDWMKKVENSINNCSLFLFYVSKKSLKSKRRLYELIYADHNDIPICLVYLDKLDEISPSFEKHFKNKPVILRYKMNNREYENKFINRIMNLF